MEHRNNASIYTNRVILDQSYIDGKGGILNALTYASAQYIYKVLERHGRDNIKWFDSTKSHKLKRTIIHKNAHLDEYFAELIFRAILPPHLKDIEVCEHVLMSKEDDTYAKISWPNGVVFGIHADETGGAEALTFFDEHHANGSRLKPSCSQLVAEEYLGNRIPKSIQKVLDEVNLNDSNKGAHQFHFAHVIKEIHDVLFIVGKDEINNNIVTKYLTEGWKRAIIDTVLTSMVYCFENDLEGVILKKPFDVLKSTEESFNYFINYNPLTSEKYYEETVKFYRDNIININPIVTAKWKVNLAGHELSSKERVDQILIIPRICYSLNSCWGNEIAKFIMMHVWNIIFQRQMNFYLIQDKIKGLHIDSTIEGEFGKISKYEIYNSYIKPEASGKRTSFNQDSKICLISIELTNPSYYNITKPILNYINNDYNKGGNNGFGIFILHDKIINSMLINKGTTFPKEIWKIFSDKIYNTEPDRWFQLRTNDNYADYILNRTKAHQDQLPSNLIDINFITEALLDI